MVEEIIYIGSKLILAIPMDECSFLRDIKHQDVANRETRPGYKVTYPDGGYVSWSPKDVFESSYRKVTQNEKDWF